MAFHRTSILVGILGLQPLVGCGSSGGSTGEPSSPGPQEARVSVRVVGGGQTGGEGSCTGAPEEPLAFSIEDAQALVLGRHETRLAYRPSWQAVAEASERGKRMIVEVSARGEPEPERVCSQWVIRLPVEVKLSLDEPALDVIIEQTLTAYRADVAELSVKLPAEVAEQLGLVEARTVAPWIGEEQPAYLSLWFGADGVRGDATGGAGCGSLVFPEGRTCVHAGGFPIETDDSLLAALKTFDALPALPVTLPDGTSTTLSIERAGEPTRLCARPFPLSALRRAEISARLRSADARIDLIVDGELNFDDSAQDLGTAYPPPEELGQAGSPRAWHFSANGFLPAEVAQSVPYFSALSEGQLAMVSLFVLNLNSSAASARLDLDTLSVNGIGQKVVAPLWVNEGSGQAPSCFDESMAPSAGVDRPSPPSMF